MVKSIAHHTHVLYRFFDADDVLLYIGITKDPLARFKGHSVDKSWYLDVARATMEHFKSREDLAAAEIRAIQTELPKYNKAYAAIQPQRDKINVKPWKQARGAGSVVGSAFGEDANYFQRPDAIACDDRNETARDELIVYELTLPEWKKSRRWLNTPCPDCCSIGVNLEGDGLVKCESCLNMWEHEEWKALTGFPRLLKGEAS